MKSSGGCSDSLTDDVDDETMQKRIYPVSGRYAGGSAGIITLYRKRRAGGCEKRCC